MEVHRNYEIYPNKAQTDLLNNHFFTSNQAWNDMLYFKIKELKTQSVLQNRR